jgi:GTP-binding protein Era
MSASGALSGIELASDSYITSVKQSVSEAAARLDQEENRDLLIFVVGEANAGKSSIINGLLGENMAEVKAIAGWTRETKLYKFSDHLFVVDTPGMNETDTIELGSGVEASAQKQADIIVFVVNLAGSRTPQERQAFRNLKAFGRPLVVAANKVDTITETDRAEVHDDLLRRFETEPAHIRMVSATTGEGMEELSVSIFQILESEGAGLLWAKNARHREALVRNAILTAATAAFGIGVIPIPLADIIPLTALQSGLWMKIGKIYGYDVTQEAAKGVITSVAAGTVGRGVFRQALKTLGAATGIGAGITAAIAGAVAASMTYGLGRSAQEYYRSGQTKSANQLMDIYKGAFSDYMKRKS